MSLNKKPFASPVLTGLPGNNYLSSCAVNPRKDSFFLGLKNKDIKCNASKSKNTEKLKCVRMIDCLISM
jgi:hypothetical protein